MQLSDSIYQEIKSGILSEDFHINELITEQAIADKYNVSKTPARDALMRLTLEGFLDKYPRKGYFIRAIGYQEYTESVELRIIVESAVVKKIIRNAADEQLSELVEIAEETDNITNNSKFHLKLAQIAGNKVIIKTLENLLIDISRPAVYNNINYNYSGATSQYYHKDIVKAILARDEEKALEFIQKDIKGVFSE